jgi:hypothetical protein
LCSKETEQIRQTGKPEPADVTEITASQWCCDQKQQKRKNEYFEKSYDLHREYLIPGIEIELLKMFYTLI